MVLEMLVEKYDDNLFMLKGSVLKLHVQLSQFQKSTVTAGKKKT